MSSRYSGVGTYTTRCWGHRWRSGYGHWFL